MKASFLPFVEDSEDEKWNDQSDRVNRNAKDPVDNVFPGYTQPVVQWFDKSMESLDSQ